METNGYLDHAEWLMGFWAGDLSREVTDMLAEGDRVVAYWTFTGTTAGATDEAPAGAKVRGTSIGLLRFREGKLVEYQNHRTGTEITS
jgi:predicted ester cyclase